MLVLVIILTILTTLATVLPLFKHNHWVFRGMDFPRLQTTLIAFALIVIIINFLTLGERFVLLLLAINVACFFWQLWWILPYTMVWPKEVKSYNRSNAKNTLNIISSNVLTTNRKYDLLLDLVRKYQPDILVTLESDSWWENKLNALETDMPYTIKCPLDNLYGIHLYSKLRLKNEEIAFLVEKNVPSIHVSIEMKNGIDVRAHFLHPAPPSPTENESSSERDAELIIVAKSVQQSEAPVLVAGDLNDVAWSSTTRLFRKISGLLDPRIGRGMFNTFHAQIPFFRWPLDHLFHSYHFTLKSIKRLPSIGSDHFPLYTSLVYEPKEGSIQNGLEAEEEDHKRSEEIVDNEGVSDRDVPSPE